MKKLFTLLFLFCAFSSIAQVRISQVYGGGGNSGATYNQDYVELYNAGATTADISNWSIQYASATGPSGSGNWTVAAIPASTTIAAGKYFLIALATGSTGTALPAADLTNTSVNMSNTAGKIALVNNSTALNGTTACSNAAVVDVLGFGTTATCGEGSVFPTTGIDNTKASHRKLNGCTDTNDNSADFEVAAVNPRNSASPANACGASSISASPNITGLSTTLGTASAEDNFNVSGSNLTGFPGNISATASANLEISLAAGGPYAGSVNIPYTSATLASTSVYVRIASSAPAGSINGTVTLAGGGDADGASITVSGSVSVNEPTTQATNVSFSNVANNSFDISWTNGNGSSRIAVTRTTGTTAVAPTDGTEYTVGQFTGTGNRVVYVGTGNSASVSSLLGGTGYEVQVYEYNGSAGSNNYLADAATGNPNTTTTTGISPNLAQQNFTSVATPQYCASGTSTRLPVMFFATVSGLSPNTTYRYINQAAATTDFGSTALGAGNCILIDHTASPMTFIYSSSPSITTDGSYGLFETDASGSFTGAFGFVNTGNARFNAGEVIYPSIAIAEDVSSPVIQYRFALNEGITALSFGTGATATEGTFIKGLSSATPGNVVGLWSTIDGNLVAQRPLAMTIAENITATGATWGGSFVSGYDMTAGAWNTIIPNANANGVRLIQQFDLATANVLGCNSDADGTWPSGVITGSPAGGSATALQVTATDAPINTGSCFSILPVSISSFNVQKTANTTKIFWTTEQEINSRDFVVERSKDQRAWTTVATVAAAGNSNTRHSYTSTDFTPERGINFYRIKTIDRDNQFRHTDTKSVLFGNADAVLITPNPATTFATIYMGKTDNSISVIVVSDLSGKIVERVRTADQTHILETARYSKGLYVVKVITGNNISTSKLVVQ